VTRQPAVFFPKYFFAIPQDSGPTTARKIGYAWMGHPSFIFTVVEILGGMCYHTILHILCVSFIDGAPAFLVPAMHAADKL